MNCPKCHSENVNFQVVAEKEQVGCLSFLLFGMFNALRPTTSKTYAVCQSCGYKWESNPTINKFKNRENPKKDIAPPTDSEMLADECNLFLHRPYRYVGRVQKVFVWIDNVKKIALGNGDNQKLVLPEGKHKIELKFYPYEHTQEIMISKKVLIECEIGENGKPKLKFSER